MSKDKAGIIPYYINDNQVFVYLMIPSDPRYGGTEPQIAKGQIDGEESPQQAAVREGEEELGLKVSNLKNVFYCCEKVLQGMVSPGYTSAPPYKLLIFAAEVINPNDFGSPHYETKQALWVGENELGKVRANQRALVQEAITKIKSIPKREWTFREFLESIETMIDPKTKKPFRHGALMEKLKAIRKEQLEKGVDDSQLWVNFTDIPRLVAKPSRAFDSKTTPHGVFGYPLSYYIDNSHRNEYAQDREYAIVFKSKVPVWDIGRDKNKKAANEWIKNLRIAVASEPLWKLEFPEKDKLIAIANKLGIDLKEIVSEIINRYEFGPNGVGDLEAAKDQFLYRVTEKIAWAWAVKEQAAGNTNSDAPPRKSSPYMKWNKLLRMMGRTNVADLQHSGAIHGGEPTQGAFLDPKDIEVIETIANKAYLAPVSRTTSWGDTDYSMGNHRHYQSFAQDQRKGRYSDYLSGSPEEKREEGLRRSYGYVFGNFKNRLRHVLSSNITTRDEPLAKEMIAVKQKLNNLIKLVRSGLSVESLGLDYVLTLIRDLMLSKKINWKLYGRDARDILAVLNTLLPEPEPEQPDPNLPTDKDYW